MLKRQSVKKSKFLPRVVTTNVEHVATELPLKKMAAEGRIGEEEGIR